MILFISIKFFPIYKRIKYIEKHYKNLYTGKQKFPSHAQYSSYVCILGRLLFFRIRPLLDFDVLVFSRLVFSLSPYQTLTPIIYFPCQKEPMVTIFLFTRVSNSCSIYIIKILHLDHNFLYEYVCFLFMFSLCIILQQFLTCRRISC